ncbi:MAG: hypothetical protein GEV28_28105 [Actinophytocola sp.]|uniref:hypothetical protein n=1 Tax=Actinophytocola sp. TaxID=1872138 RepID=UPI00132148C2|nr:hypothetical protein [Actinophytocola sp.]MPZ84049.1 hypothetical protein [Actinophytocola sp.]
MGRDLGIDAAGNRAGDALCRVPGPGRWLGGVVVAAASLVGSVLASVGGLATRAMPAAAAGGGIVVLGKVVALVQAVLGMQWRQRPPTEDEKALLSAVYRDSVNLDAIRLVPGYAGVFSANPRPFTLGNTIYLKKSTHPATLVHECAHVWQYQHLGSRYTFEALRAQAKVKPSAYRWADELDRGRAHWREFNREAQAQFLEDLVRHGHQIPPAGRTGEFFAADPVSEAVRFIRDGVDHTDLARTTVAEIRATH